MLNHHHHRISEIKNRPLGHRECTTDCKEPKCYSLKHLKNHAKCEALHAIRESTILHDNQLLLRAMARIHATPGPFNKNRKSKGIAIKSLNSVHRQKRLEEISRDNRDLLRRLVHIEPYYSNKHLADDYAKHAKIGAHMRVHEYTPSPQSLSETASRGLKELNKELHGRGETRAGGARKAQPEWNSCTIITRPKTEGNSRTATRKAQRVTSSPSSRPLRAGGSSPGKRQPRETSHTRSLSLNSSLYTSSMGSDEPRGASGGIAVASPGFAVGARAGTSVGGSRQEVSRRARTAAGSISGPLEHSQLGLPPLHGRSPSNKDNRSPTSADFTRNQPSGSDSLFADHDLMLHGFVRLCRQATKLAVVPTDFVLGRDPADQLLTVWGAVEVCLTAERQLVVQASTAEGSKVAVNCSVALPVLEACHIAQFRCQPPLSRAEMTELALVLASLVHVRSDFTRLADIEAHALTITPDTPSLVGSQPSNEKWNKSLPPTLTNKQQMKRVQSFLNQGGPHMDVLFDMDETPTATTGAAAADEEEAYESDHEEEEPTKTDGEEGADASVLFNAPKSVPLVFLGKDQHDVATMVEAGELSEEIFMTVVVQMGDFGDEFGEVLVTATTLSEIPGASAETADSGVRLSLTNRLPKFALVDEDAAGRFVQQLVACLKVEVGTDGSAELKATSNRAYTPVTGRRPAGKDRDAAGSSAGPSSFGL